uniref:(California timema) hypothetical protein n=1 Tax=Timema californicum TaxID=61474 RepID=A0A7R9P4D4_TIMCA|nr:unnamed protein product [Timema californicum]
MLAILLVVQVSVRKNHPTEVRTSISPSSAVELNTTSALANYATEAVKFMPESTPAPPPMYAPPPQPAQAPVPVSAPAGVPQEPHN